MSRENKKSLVKQVQDQLDSLLAIGQSKHAAKKDGSYLKHIYSWNTYRTYLKHCCYFVKWAKETHKCKTLADARPYVNEWLESRSGLSAYTQKLEASALAKMYGCTIKDFVVVKSRVRSEITRSRGEKTRDSHFSESRNQELIEFCKATGLRRFELESLRKDQLFVSEGPHYQLQIIGKGGRMRFSPIVCESSEALEAILRRFEGSNGFVWGKVHNGADIHAYRSVYATRIYNLHKRDDIPAKDRYYCRNDLKGTVYDKYAMKIASEALGHNRISVIAGHYLR